MAIRAEYCHKWPNRLGQWPEWRREPLGTTCGSEDHLEPLGTTYGRGGHLELLVEEGTTWNRLGKWELLGANLNKLEQLVRGNIRSELGKG